MSNPNNNKKLGYLQKPGIWVNLLAVFAILVIVITFGILVMRTIDAVQKATQEALSPLAQTNQQISQLQEQVDNILHPTPTIIPDPITIINEVRTLARLETIQYSVEKVITAETGQGQFEALFGDRLLFVAHGTVIAGVDLAKMTSGDIRYDGDQLVVRLPPPEIFITALDNQKSYVYDRDTGLLTKGDVNLETAARQVAETEIQKGVLEDGILDTAQQNAENYLTLLFADLGYKSIRFENQ